MSGHQELHFWTDPVPSPQLTGDDQVHRAIMSQCQKRQNWQQQRVSIPVRYILLGHARNKQLSLPNNLTTLSARTGDMGDDQQTDYSMKGPGWAWTGAGGRMCRHLVARSRWATQQRSGRRPAPAQEHQCALAEPCRRCARPPCHGCAGRSAPHATATCGSGWPGSQTPPSTPAHAQHLGHSCMVGTSLLWSSHKSWDC